MIRLRDQKNEDEKTFKSRLAELEKETGTNGDLRGMFNRTIRIGVSRAHQPIHALLARLEESEAALADAEASIEDLKAQLDNALGAEEMLEQLTERTLSMGEVSTIEHHFSEARSLRAIALEQKIEEMRIHIEDLETIRELNDELEAGHVETEQQLQEAIGEQKPFRSSEPH